MRMGENGVAAVVVLAVVLASTGAAVATPVVVDIVDVDPDSPFYGLERLGEQIRMVGSEAQMMERWTEYERMVERGKGQEYRGVMQEFVDRLQALDPEKWEEKTELVAWMQEKMPGIGAVRAHVAVQLCERLRKIVGDNELEREELDNLRQEMAEIRNRIRERYANENDEIRAMIRIRLEAIQRVMERVRERSTENLDEYMVIIDNLEGAEVEMEARVLQFKAEMVQHRISELKENLEAKILELRAMLEGIPENSLAGVASKRQLEIAEREIERADKALEEGKIGRAFGQVTAATAHLRIAEKLTEKAPDWEPSISPQLFQWREAWQEMKQEMVEEGTWASLLENPQQLTEQVRQQWTERWQEMVSRRTG
ncbi:MAG: hypothetical protein QXG10_02330 [Candidatus Hadarchaeales archaeon]